MVACFQICSSGNLRKTRNCILHPTELELRSNHALSAVAVVVCALGLKSYRIHPRES